MNNDLFHELSCDTLYRPDDGCDHTAIIIWEMRAGMRRHCGEEALRPKPVPVVVKNKKERARRIKKRRKKTALV